VDAQTTVVERKIRLDGSTEEFLCERLLVEPGKRAVLRYRLDRDWNVAGMIVVPKGSFTIAHYWTDRSYNVYHWVSPERRTIAYYCNVVASTSIAEEAVSYEDLVVDVLIDTSGAATVLDEEDLPTDLPSPRRAIVHRALEDLTSHSRRIAAEMERESRPFLPSG
jgi:predicted RNA-binding protein associated with RNAse of E/G family